MITDPLATILSSDFLSMTKVRYVGGRPNKVVEELMVRRSSKWDLYASGAGLGDGERTERTSNWERSRSVEASGRIWHGHQKDQAGSIALY